ncbi:hypothetical protein HMPREF9144_0434 [Prevotella pallens ATCC 700821]|uniref:Uncharacterized protein n=1 Tax=Prevotella pallens ATCC 700821 TaxID=997353 RepID=F9DFJ4_9BACT|nr:hypothetical protein HMPREF9144_0434 [Prevotella pallens ATCC 700821]
MELIFAIHFITTKELQTLYYQIICKLSIDVKIDYSLYSGLFSLININYY